MIRLPYLRSNTFSEINESPMGYTEVLNAGAYKGASIRNGKIVRVDLLYYLPEHFSDSALLKYRDVIYFIVAGYGHPEKQSTIEAAIKQLYIEDEVFRLRIGMYVYFRDYSLAKFSIYETLLLDVKDALSKLSSPLLACKCIFSSSLYKYYIVNENLFNEELLSTRGLEVISK